MPLALKMDSRSPSPPPSEDGLAFASECFESDANASGSKRPRVPMVVAESFVPDSCHLLAPVTPIASSSNVSRFIPTIPETLPQAPFQHSRGMGTGSVALCTTGAGNGAIGADDEDDEDDHVFDPLSSPESIPIEWTASKTHIILFTLPLMLHSAVPNSDGYFTIQFDWNAATADTAFNFLTSKVLGTIKRRGMACYMRFALKALCKCMEGSNSKGAVKSSEATYFSALLGAGDAKALANSASNKDLKRHFDAAFHKHRVDFAIAMLTYVSSHPVKLYTQDSGKLPCDLLPSHGDVNALARMVVLMSEPQVQPMWDAVANESRLRENVDNPGATLRVRNDDIETKLLQVFFNDVSYKAPNAVSLSAFKGATSNHPPGCYSHSLTRSRCC